MVRSGERERVELSPAPGEQLPPRDLEAEKARKRELDRQRKQRERAAAKEKEIQASGAAQDRTGQPAPDAPRVQVGQTSFTPYEQVKLKQESRRPLDDVKLITEKEAPEAQEKLVFLFMKGSEILDDVLEIIVRGHEPVRIWALDPEEAEMLAMMQLERAKKDKAAARVVRVLVALYDRIYLMLIVGPRLKATGSHIVRSGGLSFK
jgi:hypothetical protein